MMWNEHKRYEDPAKADKKDSDSMIEATKNIVEDLCKIWASFFWKEFLQMWND